MKHRVLGRMCWNCHEPLWWGRALCKDCVRIWLLGTAISYALLQGGQWLYERLLYRAFMYLLRWAMSPF